MPQKLWRCLVVLQIAQSDIGNALPWRPFSASSQLHSGIQFLSICLDALLRVSQGAIRLARHTNM
jgi:hypothetical protein